MVSYCPFHCLMSSRCVLCQFEVENGELAVAGSDVDYISGEFRLQRGDHWASTASGVDDSVLFPVHMCCGPCWPPHLSPLVCIHAECFRSARSALCEKWLVATLYSYEPTTAEIRRREGRLRQMAAEGLERAFPSPPLPLELRLKAAVPLVRELALAAVDLAELQAAPSAPDAQGWPGNGPVINLFQNVYATYVLFEGVRYVKSMRNATEAEATDGEYLVLDAGKGGAVQKVYMAFDHLGIRQVLFVPSDRVVPDPDPGAELWWRCFSRDPGISKLEMKTDGLKLRDLHDASSGGDSQRDVSWSVRDPGSATLLVDTDMLPARFHSAPALRQSQARLNRKTPDNLRMLRIACNSPDITGYSAASDGDRVLAIHAHREGGTGPDYDWLSKHTIKSHCIYMPVNPGECVTEIWLSPKRLLSHNKSQGLMFVTNRGTHTSFVHWRPEVSPEAAPDGANQPHHPATHTDEASHSQFEYPETDTDETSQPDDHPATEISEEEAQHFDHAYDCVHHPSKDGESFYLSALNPFQLAMEEDKPHVHLAFENATPPDKKGVRPASAMPLSPPMQIRDPTERYFSSCRLEGVVEVIPCRSPADQQQYPEGAVTGLLVRYANRERACVGAFRFDWAERVCEVAGTGRLCLGGGKDVGMVVAVSNDMPLAVVDGVAWMEIPLAGKLEWWFSYNKAEVHHIKDA